MKLEKYRQKEFHKVPLKKRKYIKYKTSKNDEMKYTERAMDRLNKNSGRVRAPTPIL